MITQQKIPNVFTPSTFSHSSSSSGPSMSHSPSVSPIPATKRRCISYVEPLLQLSNQRSSMVTGGAQVDHLKSILVPTPLLQPSLSTNSISFQSGSIGSVCLWVPCPLVLDVIEFIASRCSLSLGSSQSLPPSSSTLPPSSTLLPSDNLP